MRGQDYVFLRLHWCLCVRVATRRLRHVVGTISVTTFVTITHVGSNSCRPVSCVYTQARYNFGVQTMVQVCVSNVVNARHLYNFGRFTCNVVTMESTKVLDTSKRLLFHAFRSITSTPRVSQCYLNGSTQRDQKATITSLFVGNGIRVRAPQWGCAIIFGVFYGARRCTRERLVVGRSTFWVSKFNATYAQFGTGCVTHFCTRFSYVLVNFCILISSSFSTIPDAQGDQGVTIGIG